MDAYFNEECSDSKNSIEFKPFLGIVQKWYSKCVNTSKKSESIFLETKSSDIKPKNTLEFGADAEVSKLDSNNLKETKNKKPG